MRKIIYLMSVSLDGYVEGPDGKFGWSRPDEEVHRFYNKIAQDLDAFLYGRRMYETMAVWETMDQDPAMPDYIREFAQIWKNKRKVVVSRTLKTVGPNCKLVARDIEAEVRTLKQQSGNDVGVSGPGLASTLARSGLIDEYGLVVFPVMVGGGKSYFPKVDRAIPLRLRETRSFKCGAVYLRYELA